MQEYKHNLLFYYPFLVHVYITVTLQQRLLIRLRMYRKSGMPIHLNTAKHSFIHFIMRPSSLGGGRILRRTLSVCPSVPLLLPSVTSRHLANYNDTHSCLFCKKQLTERNCTIKLENWLKYYNRSNIQLQIKLYKYGSD